MRDRRFVAVHRGGSLDRERHRLLAAWAADCAEHVMTLFETYSADERPRHAIETARAWVTGHAAVGTAQKAAAAAHAVATAHMADHSLGALLYALKAVKAAGGSVDAERRWQMKRLPQAVHGLVVSALESPRLKRFA
jgi:hypothetical protein